MRLARKLKVLCLSLAVIFAIGAMAASPAGAIDELVMEGATSAWLKGTSHNNVFKITGSEVEVKCTTSQFTGTIGVFGTEATVLPAYSGKINETPHSSPDCSTNFGTDAIVDVNDCHYVVTGETEKFDPGADAEVWIQCPVGQVIEITTTLGCIIRVPTQTPTIGGVIYKNLPDHPGGKAIEVVATVTGIQFTSNNTFICQLVGIPAAGDKGDYTGSVVITGFKDLGTSSTGTEDPLTTPKVGNQIPIMVDEVP